LRGSKVAEVKSNRKNILRGSFGSGIATLLSRFLGLFRVSLEARVLGGNALAATWNLAFALPNLLRRVLGEGALAQALIPILMHTEAEHGIAEVKKQLSLVLCVLTAILAGISFIVSALALIAVPFISSAYIRDAALLLPLLMPYTIFICIVGVMTAVVNTRRVFFQASLNALILNIVLISILFAGQKYVLKSPDGFLKIMAVSVLIAGLLQILHMAFLLYRHDIFPQFKRTLKPARKIIKEVFTLAMPGMIGGAAFQISFLVDRALACYVGDYAIPALSNTERLVYLPVGIVAVALGSVLMADMSRAAANKQFDELRDDMTAGLRYVWFICAPLTIFLICYREPLIKIIFYGGNFTYENVLATADATLFYAIGIPAFCATKVLLPGFYSRKDTLTPLKISIFCIILNIPLSIVLMLFLKQGGIALATAISAMCNNMLLIGNLKRAGFAPHLKSVVRSMIKSILIASAAAVPAYFYCSISQWCEPVTLKSMPDAIPMLVCSLIFGVIYLLFSIVFKATELKEICSSLFPRFFRKKEV